ncbi:MAG: amidinotransferase [Betaproteobacteria bacterium]|nr:amidinotransferase [Betaproteobacteria bacterium]
MSVSHLTPLTSHLSPVFLMCRPTHYRIAYEINPWMSLKRQSNHARAVAQWNRLYQLLTRELGVRVRLFPPRPGVPDLVFTANAGLVEPHRHARGTSTTTFHVGRHPAHVKDSPAPGGMTGRTIIRSNFRHPERQLEELIIERYFKRAGFRIVRLSSRYDFEGEGDALWMRDTLLFGFRFRSDEPAHEELARILQARVLPVELADRRFYHLDTCFCPLDARTALWFPGAFDRYGRKVIESLVADPISVSEADATRFVCNAITIGGAVVMQTGGSARLQRQLARRGFRLHPVDLSEFLKAGGSAKCLVLRLT